MKRLLTLSLLAAALGLGAPAQAAPRAWVTSGDGLQLMQAQPPLRPAPAPRGQLIEVDPAQRFQTMSGLGASITDASAQLLMALPPARRSALLRELFGRQGDALGFSLTRLTIGASDFSTRHYSFNDLPPGQTDEALAGFSLAPQRADVIPVVRQARAINPRLQVMASPWSAPGWMKTNDSLIQGSLRRDRHGVFARYLVRYVDEMAREGVPIFALTVQNEPHFEPGDYPGMRIESQDRAALVGQHLGPLLAGRQPPVQIIEWDHNWDQPQAPLEMLSDAQARRFVSGVGWHCYAGDARVQSVVHDAHPDKDTWFTECSGGRWKPHWPETLPWMMRHVVIGSIRHWARGVLMWNLALDDQGGPHLGGCPDCRGVVSINTATGTVTRNLEYYALGHVSRWVRPGAVRIGSSPGRDGIDSVAFRNADDGSVVLALCNSAPDERWLTLRLNGRSTTLRLPRESVATVVWPGPGRLTPR
ncbi:glycoside hydrolase family 30 protein [Ideonella alba]|uniref:Glycosyl hydrolase n=1 Tax=Ideonella alba TaxID=2824118 RepID=A0A941BNF8_9BURK|nr:glycoside hydrolase family 30 beta sandwich domain-containing protein [Ideonella alba]MBQ0933289.1 glycosyl hydrolase [Ideonella alba]